MLSGTQLNATASVPGAYVYSPASGSILPVGTQTLSVAFTPTDTTNYKTAGATVSLTVNPTYPDAPTGVAAMAGNTQATVTFTAPVNDGGSAITGYTVTSIPGGGTDSNAGSTALSHIVTGLTNGTPYTFVVTATNLVGPGRRLRSLQQHHAGGCQLPPGCHPDRQRFRQQHPARHSLRNGSSSGCSYNFAGGTDVRLSATASNGFIFDGWGGDCTGTGACSTTMTPARSVTATFSLVPPVQMNGVFYQSLASAYGIAPDNAVIMLKEGTLSGAFSADRNITVTLKGGYNPAYTTASGNTTLQGGVTLRQGRVIFDKVGIR